MRSILNIYRDIQYQPHADNAFLTRKLTDNDSTVQRLALSRELKVHRGCVNTIIWNETGEYILSGSDDKTLVITNPFNGRIAARIPSGHRKNIFRARFLPCTGNRRIISCSADGGIQYNELEAPSLSGQRAFSCHSRTCYQVVTIPADPNTFLSCSEDGTIRWFDLREKISCARDNCSEDVLINCKLAVNSLAVDPVKHYYLAAGTNDSTVRIYDRRMLHTHNENGSKSAVKVFSPPRAAKNRVTHLQFNNNGSRLLANLAPRYIYEIDTQECTCTDISPLEEPEPLSEEVTPAQRKQPRVRLRGDWSDTGPSSVPESEQSAQQQSASQRGFHLMSQAMTRLIQRHSSPASVPEEAPAGSPLIASHPPVENNPLPEPAGAPDTPPEIEQSHMTLLHTYKGHRNARTTIKQCSYWGNNLVVSGSDCGHLYFWRRDSCKLIHILEADSRVVNCIQPHPSYPMLASSGIDHSIKLWSPSLDQGTKKSEAMQELTQRNTKILDEQGDVMTIPARFMMRLIAAMHTAHRQNNEQEDTEDSSSEESDPE